MVTQMQTVSLKRMVLFSFFAELLVTNE